MLKTDFPTQTMSLRRRTYLVVGALLAMISLWSCNIKGYLPEGAYMLTQNIVETDRTTPRNERITGAEINKYIRQRPSMDLWGIRAWIYCQADTVGAKWWDKFLRGVGAEPVVLDTTQSRLSAANIQGYIASRGFFNADEEYSFRLNPKNRTASVTYTTYQGEPYRINKVESEIGDNFMAKVLAADTATSLIRQGNILDLEKLGAERTRVAEKLRDYGYYDFSVADIEFRVDSTIGNHKANVAMVINGRTTGYDKQGRPIEENYPLYRLGKIKVFPSYDATRAAIDPDYLLSLDTLNYKGLEIIYADGKPNLRPSVLRDFVRLQQGALYSSTLVNSTYDNLMGMDYIRSANILFTPTTATHTPITLIGDHWSDTATTTEGVLDCEIRLAPAQRQNYKVELEASTTSSFYGVATTVGYQNRNAFRGAELFDMSFTFGYEFLKVEDPSFNRNSVELGGRVGLTFPQFLFPGDLDPTGRVQNAKTRLEFSINDQNRRYYDRVLSNITFGYTWDFGRMYHYSMRPFDVSLVKMNHVSQSFLDRLQNPYLRDSYTTQMMAGLSGSFHYGEQNITAKRDYVDLRANIGTSGNVLSGINRLLGSSKTDGHYTMFGIPYAQYIRTDLSWAQSFGVGEKSNFVYRLFGGIIYPYGNSRHESLPADRLFYAGGVNSMRGWSVRTIGPGSSAEVNSGYPSQFGNLRLEANAEFRFPIWSIFDGAVFMDAGNVWYTPDIHGVPDGAAFRFHSFVPQIALNTGFGLRLNLTVLVLRLDWGIQLHNPNKPEGERWVIANPNLNNTALNFGIGYPF